MKLARRCFVAASLVALCGFGPCTPIALIERSDGGAGDGSPGVAGDGGGVAGDGGGVGGDALPQQLSDSGPTGDLVLPSGADLLPPPSADLLRRHDLGLD